MMRELGVFMRLRGSGEASLWALTSILSIAALAGVFVFTAALTWKDKPSQQIEQAQKLYNEQKYDEALRRITEAQVEMPNSPSLQYNLGNVLYKQGKFDDARAGYHISAQGDDERLSRYATYNMGNASFKAGDLDAAIESYQKALLLDAGDEAARFNLELALRAKEQQEQQNQQDQNQQDKKDEDKKEQDKEDQSGQTGDDQKDKKQDQKEDTKQENEKPKGEQQNQQKEEEKQQQAQQEDAKKKQQQAQQEDAKKKQQQLTKDQIEQILAALREQEEQVQETLHKKSSGSVAVEKDW